MLRPLKDRSIVRMAVFVNSALITLLSFDGPVSAQGEASLSAFPLAVDRPRDVALLPPHVNAPAGNITLFADYADRRGDYVVLYLVNRTGKVMELAAEDSDVYCKLEAETAAGWQRTQGHIFSWCGNSYSNKRLGDQRYFEFLGWAPRNGIQREVRYRLYNNRMYLVEKDPRHLVDGGEQAQLPANSEGIELDGFANFGTPTVDQKKLAVQEVHSNVGLMLVPEHAIVDAGRDTMAVRNGDFEFVAAIASGDKPALLPSDESWGSDARRIAIERLVEFDPAMSIPVLLRILRSRSLPKQYLASSFYALDTLSHARAVGLFTKVVDALDDPRRPALLRYAHFHDYERVAPMVKEKVLRILQRPTDPAFDAALSRGMWPDGGEAETFKASIRQMIQDDRLPAGRRKDLREIYYRVVGNTTIQLNVVLAGVRDSWSVTTFKSDDPVIVIVTVNNIGGRELDFDGRTPLDVLKLDHWEAGPRGPIRRLNPEAGSEWLTPFESPLPADGHLTLHLNLRSVLDLPDGYQSVGVSFHLPATDFVPTDRGDLTSRYSRRPNNWPGNTVSVRPSPWHMPM